MVEAIPRRGNKTTGMSEVTGSGNTSSVLQSSHIARRIKNINLPVHRHYQNHKPTSPGSGISQDDEGREEYRGDEKDKIFVEEGALVVVCRATRHHDDLINHKTSTAN